MVRERPEQAGQQTGREETKNRLVLIHCVQFYYFLIRAGGMLFRGTTDAVNEEKRCLVARR